jgi:hypothetical protein
MIIPIQHENMSARRWPIITLALILVNLLMFFGPDDCLYYEIDGAEFRSDEIPCGGHAVFGKLRLCVEFENDAEPGLQRL